MRHAIKLFSGIKHTFHALSFIALPLMLTNCELVQGNFVAQSGGSRINEQSTRAKSAQLSLQRNCLMCHASGGTAMAFPSTNESIHAWESLGLIDEEDLSNSLLIRSMKPGFVPLMPQGRNISIADQKAIEDWVLGLEVVDDTQDTTTTNMPNTTTTTLPQTGGGNLPSLTTGDIITHSAFVESQNGRGRFYRAMQVIQAKCMSCHASAATSGNNVFPTGADFIDEARWRASPYFTNRRLYLSLNRPSNSNLLTAGNPFLSLSQSGGMPRGMNASMTVAEVAAIKDWLDMSADPTARLIILKNGLDANAWTSDSNAARTNRVPLVGRVNDKLRTRNLDEGTTHYMHAGGSPFGHQFQDGREVGNAQTGTGNQQVRFGGALDDVYIRTFNNSAITTPGSSVYDHSQSSSQGFPIFMIITQP